MARATVIIERHQSGKRTETLASFFDEDPEHIGPALARTITDWLKTCQTTDCRLVLVVRPEPPRREKPKGPKRRKAEIVT